MLLEERDDNGFERKEQVENLAGSVYGDPHHQPFHQPSAAEKTKTNETADNDVDAGVADSDGIGVHADAGVVDKIGA